MKIKNPRDIRLLLDTESNLIKKILKPKISKVNESCAHNIVKAIGRGIINKHKGRINQIVEIYSNRPSNKLRGIIIATHFVASAEKLENAETPTLPGLCDNMLNSISEIFWISTQKAGKLSCDKRNFVFAIFDKFYEGLRVTYPDDSER